MEQATNTHDMAPYGRVQCRVMRPGPGWTHINGSVWGHRNGIRIHTLGLIRFPGDPHYPVRPDMGEWFRLAMVNGGNRKRGLMALAIMLVGT